MSRTSSLRHSGAGGFSPEELSPLPPDRPNRQRRVPASAVLETMGSFAAALAIVWTVFAITGVSAPFGLVVCWLGAFLIIYGILCRSLYGTLICKDRLATVGIWAGALIAFIALVGVIGYVILKGCSAVFTHFPHFLTADMSQLGVGAAIVGTVEQVGIATLITVPLGVLTATYLVSSNGPFARLVGSVVDAMTGAPAIIAGLFVYLLWVVPHHTAGKTGLAAALALAVMMLPVVTRAAQEVVAIVPGSLREAALALGAPEWRVLVRVVLPTARAGLMTAVILGVARIAGETAPVLFNAGGFASYNWNPFSGQQDDLPLRIYELIFQPGTVPVEAAWGTSLVLVGVVLVLFLVARRLGAAGKGRRSFLWAWLGRSTVELEP
jgi:phosphate transport system permease protein